MLNGNIKTTSEVVIIFWQDNQPVGMLMQNGQSHFYKITRALKDFVASLLGVNAVVDQKAS